MFQRAPCYVRIAAVLCALTGSLVPCQAQDAAPKASPAAAPPPANGKNPDHPIDPATTPPAPTLPAAKPANPTALAEVEAAMQPVRRLSSSIESLEKAVERVKERDDELARQRQEIEAAAREAQQVIEGLRPRLAGVRSQIDKLGPPPKADEPQESAEIAAERERLNTLSSQIDGGVKTMDLVQVRARQLLSRVQELRQAIFTRQILRRTQYSPLSPSVWRDATASMPDAWRQISTLATDWWRAVASRWLELCGILGAALVIYFVLGRVRHRLVTTHLHPREAAAAPSFLERSAAAAWLVPLLALPPAAALLVLYGGLANFDMLYLQTQRFAGTGLTATLIYLAISALARATLQPDLPQWRLLGLSDASAARLSIIVRMIAAVYALDYLLRDVIRLLFLPFQVSVCQTFIASLLLAMLFFAIVRTPFAPQHAGGLEPSRSDWWPRWLKMPLALAASAIILSLLTGYVALARYIAGQIVLTGSAFAFLILLHLAARSLFAGRTGDPATQDGNLNSRTGLASGTWLPTERLLLAATNAALLLLGLLLLLLAWGYSVAEVSALLQKAFFGFEAGNVRISLAQILSAIALFVVLFFLTRLLQRWLSRNVLQKARIDQGLAHSIDTVFGYAGFAVAAVAAISYAGLDFTNLAIVAGALSVGIGLGLQSIVNNFVSGLILLAERPIKVGDLITVGTDAGHVRRISVRATEIETGDRASLIIPNSLLITGTVKNMTHRNALGRINVPVRVTYKADPEHVLQLLTRVASECPSVLRHPVPAVTFTGLGPNGMEFSINTAIADVNRAGAVETELRTAIVKALQRAGIEIPYAQHDVHLRDLDMVRSMLTRLAEERARQSAASRTEPNTGASLKPSNDDD